MKTFRIEQKREISDNKQQSVEKNFFLKFVKSKFLFTFAVSLQLISLTFSCKYLEKAVKSTMASSRPSATLNVRVNQYSALVDLGNRVFSSMTGNISFTTPIPTLLAIQTAVTAVENSIAAWGPVGNRGSHLDLVTLRDNATILRNLLIAEAQYVTNTAGIAAGSDYTAMATIIASSGFGVKNSPLPQGLLAAPQNLHQMFSNTISIHTPKIAWKKPIGLTSPNNVKSYQVIRSLTNDIMAGTVIATTTKTSFIDLTTAVATIYYYFVKGVNTDGPGNESAVCQVNTPA